MSAFTEARMHLAVELDGARSLPPSGPSSTAGLVRAAAARGLDLAFLTVPRAAAPSGAAPSDLPTTTPLPDAVAAAVRIAPVVPGVGLVPQVDVTGADGGRLAAALATLRAATGGRAGWEPVATGEGPDPRWRRAAEVLDAVARPGGPTTGPLVVVRADGPAALALAARRADVVRVAAPDLPAARAARDRVRDAVAAAGRHPDGVRVLLDVEVHLSAGRGQGRVPSSVRVSGTPADLADVVEGAVRLSAADGVTFLPLALPGDLRAVTAGVVPLLAARGLYRTGRAGVGLRARLGLADLAAARVAS